MIRNWAMHFFTCQKMTAHNELLVSISRRPGERGHRQSGIKNISYTHTPFRFGWRRALMVFYRLPPARCAISQWFLLWLHQAMKDDGCLVTLWVVWWVSPSRNGGELIDVSSVGLVDDCFIAGFVVMQSPSTLGGVLQDLTMSMGSGNWWMYLFTTHCPPPDLG